MGFLWFGKNQTEERPYAKQPPRRPVYVDYTDSYSADVALTRGLYHNTYNGFKLAGGLAYPVIALPVYFMGFPCLKTIDERLKELADQITKMQKIHLQSHREGTIWIFPKYNSSKNKVMWEFISDDTVTDIVRSLDNGEIIELYTSEQMTISTGENEIATITRSRKFTKTMIIETYSGDTVSSKLTNKQMRNPVGIIPIPFSNNADGDEVRGHSDLERIIALLKNYHDISLAEYQILAKFKPKMIQKVKNVNEWMSNNGYGSITEIDIGSVDLILNVDGEETDFKIPQAITSEHREAKVQIFQQIVESSGIPEIVWGLKTSGNHASIEEQFATFAQYIGDKQRQKTEAYLTLFEATLRLELKASMNRIDVADLEIEWNDLDTMSEKVQSEIFKNYSEGMQKLVDSASISQEQLYNFWIALYPSATEDDFKKWQAGAMGMAKHKQYKDASYLDTLGAAGIEEETE